MRKLITILFIFFTIGCFAQQSIITDNPYVTHPASSSPTAYLYYKWHIITCRSSTNLVQMDEFNLYYSGSELDYSSSTATYSSSYDPSQPPVNAFDNSTATKFVGYNISSPKDLIIQLSSAQAIDSYTYTTGSDASDRDPITWELYGSNDGSSYALLDSQTTVTITSSRNTETQIFTIP